MPASSGPTGASLKRPPLLYVDRRPQRFLDVNPAEIWVLHSFFDQYRASRAGRGHIPPHARYVFITSASGAIRMHPRYRHPVLADGDPVRYAGEAEFEHGRLQWWSNASGHYQPDARHADQAGLPLDRFLTHEQVRAGAHRAPAYRRLR